MGCGSSLSMKSEEASVNTTACNNRKISNNHLSGDRISMVEARSRRESKCAQQHRRASMLAPFEAERVRERRKSSCASLRMSAGQSRETLVRARAQTWDGPEMDVNDQNNNEVPGYYNKIVIEVQDFPSIRVNEKSTNLSSHDNPDNKEQKITPLITKTEPKMKLSEHRKAGKQVSLEESAAIVVKQAMAKAVTISSDTY